ncbi:MAG: hypothetical protein IKB20_06235 [Clostridia bacterium]|nr:hypothetical protein [Clostridia bacterium]
MSVDKIVLRAFLSTLLAIVSLLAGMTLVLVAAFPSTLMELSYNLGMDSSSIWYAKRAYKHGEDIYFIAYATDVAIGIGDYEKIECCGEKMLADNEFAAYCAEKNESMSSSVSMTYDQYVYGQVCVAMYAQGKKTEAVNRAFELTMGFPNNNAVVAVLYTAIGEKDSATVAQIKGKMEQMQGTLTDTDKAYFEWVLSGLSE